MKKMVVDIESARIWSVKSLKIWSYPNIAVAFILFTLLCYVSKRICANDLKIAIVGAKQYHLIRCAFMVHLLLVLLYIRYMISSRARIIKEILERERIERRYIEKIKKYHGKIYMGMDIANMLFYIYMLNGLIMQNKNTYGGSLDLNMFILIIWIPYIMIYIIPYIGINKQNKISREMLDIVKINITQELNRENNGTEL